MKNTSLFSLLSIAILMVILAGCSTDSGPRFQEPTFDNVPEPFDLGGVEAEPVQDGISKYIVEEGYGEDKIVIRDQVLLFLTLRNENGDIIYSTYQDNRTSPVSFEIVEITPPTPPSAPNFEKNRSYTNGLRKGLIGMREGEKRVLIVPPSEGYANIQGGTINEAFRNDTLRYDIELNAIL